MQLVIEILQVVGYFFFALVMFGMVYRTLSRSLQTPVQEKENTPIRGVAIFEYSFEYIEENSVHNICMELNKKIAEGVGFRVIGWQLEGAKKIVLLEIIKERQIAMNAARSQN